MCLFLGIFFLAMAYCNYTDDKWFSGIRAKKLNGEKRKKFRRIEALGQLLAAVRAFALFIVEDQGILLGLTAWIFLYVGGGVLLVVLAWCVEIFYFKKLIKEESV